MTTDTPQTPLSFFHPVSLLATWFGSGKSPKAPGTMGSIAALPFAYAIHTLAGAQILMLSSLILFFVGIWVSDKYVEANGTKHDPGEIVIDEVVGVWLILVALPITLNGYIFGFLLFRVFDIFKPWPISVCDKHVPGGFGIMLDDLLAAIYPVLIIGLLVIFCGITGQTWMSDFYEFLGKNGF
ncbi:MAG: phosphatidylglycerophosphatase A [Alphaproteobacteria bacterium]|nr:phosphatidylglycerophosphatase A [Alphaproteobacteria bacterium]